MKNLKLIIFFFFCVNFSFAQNDSLYVIKQLDTMSDKTYIFPNRNIYVYDQNYNLGFIIYPFIEKDLTISNILVLMFGLGQCNENNELIILFDNEEKIIKKSWRKYNCNAETYFEFNEYDLNLIKNVPMKKIRLTNGITFANFTGEVSLTDKSYFIKLFQLLDNKIIVEK